MKRALLRTLILSGLALLSLVPLAAQYNPPAGAGSLFDFYSPIFLGGGAASLSGVSPVADVLNPAASGFVQQTTLDFSYIGLLGTGDQSGLGHALNAGLTYPTRAGVLAGSAHLLYAPPEFGSLDLGTLLALNVSFAKDLYPNLLVGAGLGVQIGADWGLGLDLGLVHRVGDLKGLKNFSWGAALRGLGKGYGPVDGRDSFPAAFTPAVGLGFDALQSRDLTWSIHSDVSFPSFQDVRFSLGTALTFRELLTVRLSSTLDVAEMLRGEGRAVPLAGGLSLQFNTPVRKQESKVQATAAVAPLRDGLWGLGAGVNIPIGRVDADPPRLSMATEPVEYISPNLDGVKDDLTRKIGITRRALHQGLPLPGPGRAGRRGAGDREQGPASGERDASATSSTA